MPTNGLPTAIAPGDSGHISHHDLVHDKLNPLFDDWYATGGSQGLVADRPSDLDAANEGFQWWNTDIMRLDRWNGSSWDEGIGGGAGDIGSGTWSAMQAAAGLAALGDRWVATDQLNALYWYNGTRWRLEGLLPGQFAPIEYGADPLGAADSRAAAVACIAAASTPLATGLPYSNGNLYGEVVWTAGQYKISSSITLPNPFALKMTGIGGNAADYQWGQRVVINFTSGGFILSTSQSNAVEWDGLEVIGAPALFCDNGSGPGQMRNCELRSVTAGQPALQIRNAFWGEFKQCTFRAPNTTTPSILIESSTALGSLEGWLFRWNDCRFYSQGVRWDCYGSNATVPGMCTSMIACDTENFGSTGALMHLRNTHPTQDFTWYDLMIKGCSSSDSDPLADLVRVENLGAGTFAVQSIHIENSGGGGNGYDVNLVSTGGGITYANMMFITGSHAPYVHFSGVTGSGVMGQQAGSYWYFIGDRAVAPGYTARVNGDTQDRIRIAADGRITRGLGSATPDVIDTIGNGSPESVVSSAVGGSYARRDGGSGTCQYVKTSGTGNTGWTAVH